MAERDLLKERLRWERENPRPVSLVHAERMIVRALNDYGFGRQYQVTRDDSFEIAVDDLLIQVKHLPTPVPVQQSAELSAPNPQSIKKEGDGA